MAKQFDASLNKLIDLRPAEWAGFFAARAGVPPGPVEVLDTDLSSTLQADKLFRVNGPTPAALHLEFEVSGRLGVPDRLLRYNVAARGVLGPMPVQSVIVLLRPEANATDLTGILEVPGADGRPYLTFRYTVVRVWQESADALFAAGPSLAPLALLTNEAAADLPATVDRFGEQLRADPATGTLKDELVTLSYFLCGLRYPDQQMARLLMGLKNILEESSTYQATLNQGRAKGLAEGKAEGKAEGTLEGERILLLIQGRKRFGAPPPERAAELAAITDRARLERMAERILDAAGWDDLLATS
jgi:hypothetical protein